MQKTSIKGYQENDPFLEQRVIGYTNLRTLGHFRPRFKEAEFQKLKIPILVLLGEKEVMYRPEQARKRIQQLLPFSKVAIVPNSGHALNRDQPQIVNKHLLDFFQEVK
jgi:pimeloyl-ACP methyl ester carboxylesterase